MTFPSDAVGDTEMAQCERCHQPIIELVVTGRKLVAQIHPSPREPAGAGRYVTVVSSSCGCGTWTEKRYETIPMRASWNYGAMIG